MKMTRFGRLPLILEDHTRAHGHGRGVQGELGVVRLPAYPSHAISDIEATFS